MHLSTEKYLDLLLTFVPKNKGGRFCSDYISLIHVPTEGTERVYSLTFDKPEALFTVASYNEVVWKSIAAGNVEGRPDLDALQTTIPSDHLIFQFLQLPALAACETVNDGSPAGLDYYLMQWQKDGQANVVECYEPYSRGNQSWLTVIGSLQALSRKYEYAISV